MLHPPFCSSTVSAIENPRHAQRCIQLQPTTTDWLRQSAPNPSNTTCLFEGLGKVAATWFARRHAPVDAPASSFVAPSKLLNHAPQSHYVLSRCAVSSVSSS
jgi:hypothetical protein